MANETPAVVGVPVGIPIDMDDGLPTVIITNEMPPASTPVIKSGFRKLGRIVTCSGFCSAVLYFVISILFFWYAQQIPWECNRDFSFVFNMLGLWNAILGLVSAGFAMTAREIVDAMSHAELARKYQLEGRDIEAAYQESQYRADIRCASGLYLVPACLYIAAQAGLLVTWIWGFVQIAGANYFCSGPVTLIWILFVLDILSFCVSAGTGGGAQMSYRGYMW